MMKYSTYTWDLVRVSPSGGGSPSLPEKLVCPPHVNPQHPKNADFVIFMQFFAILPKLHPPPPPLQDTSHVRMLNKGTILHLKRIGGDPLLSTSLFSLATWKAVLLNTSDVEFLILRFNTDDIDFVLLAYQAGLIENNFKSSCHTNTLT